MLVLWYTILYEVPNIDFSEKKAALLVHTKTVLPLLNCYKEIEKY